MVESALYILAGIALYGGAHQLYLGAQRTPDHPHVMHGVMYLLLCAFALASAFTYQSHSVATLVPAGKLGVSIGLLLWGVLAWFIAACTDFKPRLLLAALSVAWSLLLIGNIGAPFSLLYSEVTPVTQTLASGQLQMALHTRINPWWTVVQLVMLVSLLFSLYASFKLYRADEKRAALALGSGLLVLLGASVSDALVQAGQIQSAFLGPFGFLVLLVSAGVYPGLQAKRRPSQDEAPATSYNMTFHLNQPPRFAGGATFTAPLQEKATVDIRHAGPAEIIHEESAAPVIAAPEPATEQVMPDAAGETLASEPEAATPQTGQSRPAPALDETVLTEVSDNLIDIAVYATMAMNRCKRGAADPETLEALFRKVRTQAINTRRIANRMMHADPDKSEHEEAGRPPAE